MIGFGWLNQLWVLALLIQLCLTAPQGNTQFPDNYSVYVRALQNQNHSPTPSPYSAPIQPQNQGYSPPLAPQAQPYRPPLIPHIQPDFNHQGNFGHSQPNILQPSQPPPQQPQVRNFPQYQPPLLPQFQPSQPSHSQPLPQPQRNNNQQVIYVGGQQRQYVNSPPQQPSAQSPSAKPPQRSQPSSNSNAQPSFSTSFTSDAARQGKVVSGQAPAQAIQKAPASEIQFDKGAAAKDKDASNKKKDDEYVIYYYYYYDDENKKNNLTLNFDDIPNLEQYDNANKTTGRSNVVANGVPNSLQSRPASAAASHQSGSVHNVLPGHNDYLTTASPPRSATAVSVSVSVSEGPQQSPVPNVYRYGNSEIPRAPIIKHGDLRKPSTAVTNAVTVENTVVSVETKAPLTEVSSTTPSVLLEETSEATLEKPAEEANDVGDTKKNEVKKSETPEPETTTTEASTTEEPTTTTETSRRPGYGNRRRFQGNSNRISPSRRPSTTTTTESAVSSTRRTPRPRGRRPGESSRVRPTRPRGRSTTPAPKKEEEEDEEDTAKTSSTTPEPDDVTTVASRRFGATGRRFSSSRSGASRTTTTSTTAAPERYSPRGTPRPRPGGVSPRTSSLFGRTRPPTGRLPGRRPSPLSRNKPVVVEEKPEEEEEKETVVSSTSAPEEDSKASTTESGSQSSTQAPSEAPEEVQPEDEDKEESEATEAASSTTEAPRKNPLFRTRTRAPLFNNNRARPNPLSRNRPGAASK